MSGAAPGHGTPPDAAEAGTMRRLMRCREVSAQRSQAVLRLAFAGVLTVAVTAELPVHRAASQLSVLSGYGVIAVVVALCLRRPHGRAGTTAVTVVMGLVDVAALVVLQILSGDSALLVFALFLLPLLAAFNTRPAVTALLIVLDTAAYATATSVNTSIHHQLRNTQVVVLLVFLVLVGACSLALSLSHARRCRQVAQLIADRSRLLVDVMSAEERERTRLAEFLHDGPLQAVLAARFDLQQSMARGDADATAELSGRLLDVARQLRQTTGQLHPEVLRTAGLGEAVRSLVRGTAERRGITIGYTYNANHQGPTPHDLLVYYAARELLDNVARHSSAARAHVTLVTQGGKLRLTVTDDGVGTDPARLRQRLGAGHIGLASQRVRVEAAGGRMEHLPTEVGTRVRITLPLTAADPKDTAPQRYTDRADDG